jgi:trigger factor
MELNFNKIDNLNATLVVTLEKADYAPSVEKELKKQQKQAVIKGFRPGAAPMGMIKSMYAKSILAEEINRLASNGLYDYLKEQNIDIIAQPLPSETLESDIDIEKGETFVFAFDLGLAPIFDFNISKKDTLDKYVISVDETEVDKEVENLSKRYGKLDTVEVSEEKDIIYATATELNESNTSFEGGVNDKEISFTADLITDEAVKKQLTGVQAGTVLNLNIYSLFNENHTVIASTLGIAKEAVADLNPTFKISITEVKRQIPAELNQELFDQVMGEGVVTDIDAFRAKIKENLEAYYKNESDQQVEHMISHLLEEKHEVPLPDAFLKRWLLNTKEEQYSADNIDERYENESKVLKEILIREKAAAQYELKVEQQDIEDASLGYTLSLFRNYGLQNPDFEFVKKFSDDSLKKRDYIEQMNDIAIRRKVYNQVKEIISYNEKPVSIEEFYKLIETHNHQHQH